MPGVGEATVHAEREVLVMAQLTMRDIQDRLLILNLGRMITLPDGRFLGLSTFVSDKVMIGRTDHGFLIYVHERGLVKTVRTLFADASGQVTVTYMSRARPLND